jgi:hypothetical protein
MPSAECGFCGQRHVPLGVVEGFEVIYCPNLPDGWVAIGPDESGNVTIVKEGDDGFVRG